MEIVVPQPEKNPDGSVKPWPTLGPQVCDFLEERMVFGPGSLAGEPYKVRDDIRYILYRAYEHYPEGYTYEGNDLTGRRRFKKVIISWPKGLAKTELMAVIACLELHPDAPIRFNGYDPKAPGGMAPGRSVRSPYIPLLAPTKDQLNDLAYGVAMEIMKTIPDSGLFDPTMARILIQGEENSKILPVAPMPNTLDGKKPTFQGIDETHRLEKDRHHQSVQTMENNLGKRYEDDPWQLCITTAGDPNIDSVASRQFTLGMKIYEGRIQEPDTLFYHRQTSDKNAVFDTIPNRLKALREASGPEASQYRDLLSIARMWDNPDVDPAYLERVWCNRWVASARMAFKKDVYAELGDPMLIIPRRSPVVLGFDGAVAKDSTALVMTEIKTGVQNLIGLWEKPDTDEEWRVPVHEVNEVVNWAFKQFNVAKMYCDPYYWTNDIDRWAGVWGSDKVVSWPTTQLDRVYYAIRAYQQAIEAGAVAHDSNKDLIRHVGNCGISYSNLLDGEGHRKFRLSKLQSENKIDAAMAAILSWKARMDCLTKGYTSAPQASQLPFKIR